MLDGRTASISAAFWEESFLSTRSTDWPVLSFLKLSRIVAAVKSTSRSGQLATAQAGTETGTGTGLTAQRVLVALEGLKRGPAPVQRFDVRGIEFQRGVAVCDHEVVRGRGLVQVTCGQSVTAGLLGTARTCGTVAEEDGFGLRRDLDGAGVEVYGGGELALLVCVVPFRLERGSQLDALLEDILDGVWMVSGFSHLLWHNCNFFRR